MKKVLFGLCALMVCCFMSSCSTDYVGKAKDFVAEIEKNGNDWDADKWESVMNDMFDLTLDFYKSSPTKEQYEEFSKIKLEDALGKLKEDAQMKAFAALMKIASSDKYKEIEKAEADLEKSLGDKEEKKD